MLRRTILAVAATLCLVTVPAVTPAVQAESGAWHDQRGDAVAAADTVRLRITFGARTKYLVVRNDLRDVTRRWPTVYALHVDTGDRDAEADWLISSWPARDSVDRFQRIKPNGELGADKPRCARGSEVGFSVGADWVRLRTSRRCLGKPARVRLRTETYAPASDSYPRNDDLAPGGRRWSPYLGWR